MCIDLLALLSAAVIANYTGLLASSVDSLHNIEKDLNAAFNFVLKSAKVNNAGELNETVMTKMHKGPPLDYPPLYCPEPS